MFCRTINEWRKNIKPLNEGGGAGISFKTSVNIYFQGIITKDTFEVTTKSITADESFSAEGYDDGMSKVKSDIINFTGPELTREMVLAIKLDDGTVIEELNKPETESIKFQLETRYNYDNMHFGGWVRGKFAVGDVVFSQELNRNKEFDVVDDNIDLTVVTADGENILDVDVYNDEILKQLAPVGTATEEFTYFYQDVFDYNNLEDAKSIAYQAVTTGDGYDSELEEYMLNNDLTMPLEEYKLTFDSLEELPEDLYKFLQSEKDIETMANDTHWQDVETNYGI